jgi:nucleoside-diphosphate-sugar epimerase
MSAYLDLVKQDLDYICRSAREAFRTLAGAHVLITGGAGFLGYYFVQSLLHWNKSGATSAPIRVTVYDRCIDGFVPVWLAALEDDPHLRLVSHDISKGVSDSADEFQFIIHAASIASPAYYRMLPLETMDANVYGLRTLLEYSRTRRINALLFLSSSEVYGDPLPGNIPTPETYWGNVSFTGPRACYDESKRFGETLCVNFAQQFDLPIKIVRPFNNYGPGMKLTDRRVIADFCKSILEGNDIQMFSDGSPTRTFCYVADAIIGYFKVLTRGRAGEAYNIGVEDPEISIADLAARIVRLSKDLFGYKGRVVRQISSDKAYLVDNPSRRCPSLAKARSELGYAPAISLDEGLRRSLIWYRGICGAELG